jgi:hypothetical protein
MRNFDFVVVLAPGTEMTEDLANRLFEAGCDDGSPGVSCGITNIGFSREAESLEAAIRSAVADVQKTGCTVQRVEIESDSPLLTGTP